MGAGQSRTDAGQGHLLQMDSQPKKVVQPAELVASHSDAQQGRWSHVQPQQSSVPVHSSALPGGVAESTVVPQLQETNEQMPLGVPPALSGRMHSTLPADCAACLQLLSMAAVCS